MKNVDEEESPKKKEPIFLERGDGLGWTLNFDRPISYVLVAGFILMVAAFFYFN